MPLADAAPGEGRPGKPTVIITFGGGLNANAPETIIDVNECADGKNFDLDVDDHIWKRRKPFQLVGTATNGQEIRGFIQLEKADGTRSFLVQAGDRIYEWDGTSSGFTVVAPISAAAKLRGSLAANSVKDGKVYVTDLNLQETVKQWDGTTWGDLPTSVATDFYAKYCVVAFERAIFGNVKTTTTSPHLLVASKRDEHFTLSTSNRPSSSLGVGDAFYLPTPNLKPINGLISALGRVVLGTKGGNFYKLDNNNAQDHVLGIMYASNGGSGDEGLVFTDNDIFYSRAGAIDTLAGTEKFGDIAADDLTRWLKPLVKEIPSWTLLYSPRIRHVYCFPSTGGEIHVLHKELLDERVRAALTLDPTKKSRLSPWSIWQTDHSFDFQPTTVAIMKRPTDGLEFPYMGGPAGEIYQLEAETAADPSSTTIVSERLSKVFDIPPGDIYEVSGWVRYRKIFATTLTLTFEYGGRNIFDESITVSLDAADNAPVYGGSAYYGGSFYYGTSFNGRLHRKTFPDVPGANANQIQVRAKVDDDLEFFIESIGLQFKSHTP